MKAHKSQVERIGGTAHPVRLYLSQPQCLSTFPAITRLGARIKDLEAKGWVEAKAEGADYVYRVVSAQKVQQLVGWSSGTCAIALAANATSEIETRHVRSSIVKSLLSRMTQKSPTHGAEFGRASGESGSGSE